MKKIKKDASLVIKERKKLENELASLRSEFGEIEAEYNEVLANLSSAPVFLTELRKLEKRARSFTFIFCGKKERERTLRSIQSLLTMTETFPSKHELDDPVVAMLELGKKIARKEMQLESLKEYEDAFDFYEILDVIGQNTWHNSGPSVLSIEVNGRVLKFVGDVIEPSYEFFTAVVNIYLDGECIFGEGSRCAGSYRKERTSFGKFENLDVAVRFLETELDGIEVEYKL